MSPTLVRRCLPALTLVLIVLAVYAGGLQNRYVEWDDSGYIRDNPALQTPGGLARIWTRLHGYPQYYPLTFTMHWLEYRLWGSSPAGYYAVNVLLHAGAAVLVLALSRRLGVSGPAACVAAALFAVHPMQVASVAWLAERKNVLSAVFALGAFLLYLRHRGGGRFWQYLAAVALFACALLSKTAVAPLPLSILAADRLVLHRRDWGGLWRVLPMLALAAAAAGLTVSAEHSVPIETGEATGRPLAAAMALWFYLGRLLWPAHLPALYPPWSVNPASVLWWLPGLGLTGVIVAALCLRRRLHGVTLWGAVHFVLMLLPVLGFIPFGYLAFAPVADHFVYLALIGPLLAVSAASGRWYETGGKTGPRIIPTCAALAVLVLCIRSWYQVHIWHDAGTLWPYTLRHNPDSPIAHNNLGLYLERTGDGAGALEHYAAAVRLDPDYAQAQNNVAAMLGQQGRLAEAIEHSRAALRLQPDLAEAHNTMGSHLAKLGRYDQAIEHFIRAVELKPTLASAHANWGFALLELGRVDEGLARCRQALRLDNTDPLVHMRMGEVLSQRGETEDALAHFEAAMRLSPGEPRIASGLAWTLATWDEADPASIARAVRIAEGLCAPPATPDAAALDVLAAAYAAAGRFEDAVRVAESALSAAASAGWSTFASEIEGRIRLYRVGRPYLRPRPGPVR